MIKSRKRKAKLKERETEKEDDSQEPELKTDLSLLRLYHEQKKHGLTAEQLEKISLQNRKDSESQEQHKSRLEKQLDDYIYEKLIEKALIEPTVKETKKEKEEPSPNDDLLKLLPQELLQTKNKEIEEGSAAISASMLTQVPEVQLGMEVKLKNMEETEKLKRQINTNEQHTSAQIKVGERWWYGGVKQSHQATDHLVADQFKKRMKKF